MTDFDAPARFWELLDAVFEGRIDARQIAELEALIAHNEPLRRLFLEHLQLHVDIRAFGKAGRARRMLHDHIGNGTRADENTPRESPEPAPAPTSRRPLPRQAPATKGPGWLRSVATAVRHPMTLVAAVSVVAAVVLAYSFSTMPVQQPVAHAPPPAQPAQQFQPATTKPAAIVATISDTRDAVWNRSQGRPAADMLPGQRLQLDSGLVEIRFASQAKVLLEGPVELTLDGVNRCHMSRGKLVAQVPQQAHGFTVETPSMTVVDKGTQFGVRVKSEVGNPKSDNSPTSDLRPPTSTSVQVFQGLVEVQRRVAQVQQRDNTVPTQPAPISLKAGEAISSQADSQPRKVEGNPAGYVRELPPAEPAKPVELVPLATWPKDSPLKPGDIVAVANGKTRFHLLKIDPHTGQQKLLAEGFPFRQAPKDHGLMWTSVAVEPNGLVLVGAKGLGAQEAGLLRIDPRNGRIDVVTRGGMLTAGDIVGLAVASDGTIYAAYRVGGHGEADQVLKIDPASGKVSLVARFGERISGLCFDQGGRDLLASSTTDATLGLVQLSPEPKVTAWQYERSLIPFCGVTVNRQGRIFVGIMANVPGDGGIRVCEQQIIEVGRDASQPVRKLALTSAMRGCSPLRPIVCEADGNLIVGPGGELPNIYRVETDSGKVAVLSTGGWIENISSLAVVLGKPSVTAEAP